MRRLGKARQTMGAPFQVKKRLSIAALTLAAGWSATAVAADPPPDAMAILKAVRVAQTSEHIALLGGLRTGPTTVPFRLVIDGQNIRYEFTNPTQAIALHLGEKTSKLEEVNRSGTEKIPPARYDAKVRGSDISYEDLAMHFLYWPEATLDGEETKILRKCWKLEVKPGSVESQYSRVTLWVEEESGALLQAEAYDKAGKLARRFSVKSVQKADGVWILKQMRIEQTPGAGGDRTPTYLEISGVEKEKEKAK